MISYEEKMRGSYYLSMEYCKDEGKIFTVLTLLSKELISIETACDFLELTEEELDQLRKEFSI